MSDVEDKYTAMGPDEVCDSIGQPYKKSGGACITACWNTAYHKNGDRKPSMAVYGYERGYYCFTCGDSGSNSWLLKQFGVRDDNYQPKQIDRTARTQEPDAKELLVSSDAYCTKLMALYDSLPELPQSAIDVLEGKGLFADMFDELPTLAKKMQWKWHTDQVRGWGEGIFIPYVFNGRMITARLRRLSDSGPRFLSMPGNTMWPYNLDAVMRHDRVFVTEGETDCLTVNMMGLPAVGIPGATSGRAIARLIEQAQNYNTQLIVLPDNDQAGTDFAKRIQLAGADARVAVDVAKVPRRKDVNDWYMDASASEINDFLERYTPRIPKRHDVDFTAGMQESGIQEVKSWSQLAVSL